MPAASYVYRNINVHKTFDSSRSRTFNFTILFYKHANPPDLYVSTLSCFTGAERMPAASYVYRNINVHKTFDSSRSRTFNFTILFYKHANPPDLYVSTLSCFTDAERMPTVSHVYRNHIMCMKFDSGRSRTFPFAIHFYKHSNPLDLYF